MEIVYLAYGLLVLPYLIYFMIREHRELKDHDRQMAELWRKHELVILLTNLEVWR